MKRIDWRAFNTPFGVCPIIVYPVWGNKLFLEGKMLVAMILFFGAYGTLYTAIESGSEPSPPAFVLSHEAPPQPPMDCYLAARYDGLDSDAAFEECQKP